MPVPIVRSIVCATGLCLAGAASAQEVISLGSLENEETLGRWTLTRFSEGTCVVSAAAERPQSARLVAGIAQGKAYRMLAVEGLEGEDALSLVFSNGARFQAEMTVTVEGAGVSGPLPALLLMRPDEASHPYVQNVGDELVVVLPADVRRNTPGAADEAQDWIERQRLQAVRGNVDMDALWRSLAQSSRLTLAQGGAEARVSLAGSSRALRALAACADG